MITDRYLALPISVKAKRDEHNEDSSTPNWQAKEVIDGSDSSAALRIAKVEYRGAGTCTPMVTAIGTYSTVYINKGPRELKRDCARLLITQ